MENKLVSVMVAYALPQQQWVHSLQVPVGSNVAAVLEECKKITPFNQLDLNQHKIGIFGKEVALEHIVEEGDRIEIYRALILDPMEARRRRAEKNKR